MRKKITKLFWIWQLDKEEAWINEMASHGYSLEHAGRMTFEFDETEQGLYRYKTLFLKGSAGSSENIEYFRFLEEMGIKIISYINYPGTCCVYTRGLASDFPDGLEIYSDIDSRINYLKVTAGYLIFVAVFTLFAGVLNAFAVFLPQNGLALMNSVLVAAMLLLCIFASAETIKTYIKIGNLKKEREIHE